MQYRVFGNTGMNLSALGFGAMRLPADKDAAARVMCRSFELGVNYLDTALGYPDSEVKCAKALEGWRDKVYISTKNPLGKDYTIEGWWSRLNKSLEQLETDHIDFYQVIHDMSLSSFEHFLLAQGGLKAVRKAQDQGLVKHVCFSCHDTPENLRKIIDTGEFDGMTVQYNLLDRKYEDVIAHAHEKGMGIIIMGPVGGGRLGAPSEQIQHLLPTQVKSSAEVALRFVFANPNITCAISGMNTVEMVEENCAIASRNEPLSEDEKQTIDQALNENQRLAELYCTGCNYCMPCPNEVNIPQNFILMNYHRLYGLTDHAKSVYKRLGDPNYHIKGKKAEDCIECGQCEPKCPQHIKIMAQLQEVAQKLKE